MTNKNYRIIFGGESVEEIHFESDRVRTIKSINIP